MSGHIERVARGLRASRDRRLNGKDDDIVRDLAVGGLQALAALEAELAAARRENATLREALEGIVEGAERRPWPADASALGKFARAALAASPAAEEPQP